jgi:PhnB protein
MSNLTPYLTVRDAAAAIEFYKKAFGAAELGRHAAPDGVKLMHAHLKLPGGGEFMLSDDFPEFNEGKNKAPQGVGGSPVTLHITLTDADPTWAQAVAAGATITMPLADQFWGDRYGKLRDPFGHEWSLSSPTRK